MVLIHQTSFRHIKDTIKNCKHVHVCNKHLKKHLKVMQGDNKNALNQLQVAEMVKIILLRSISLYWRLVAKAGFLTHVTQCKTEMYKCLIQF